MKLNKNSKKILIYSLAFVLGVKGFSSVAKAVNGNNQILAVARENNAEVLNNNGRGQVETKAQKIENLGGLSPVDIKVWIGEQVDWSKGIKATNPQKENEIRELLNGATITDKTNPARNTTTETDLEGNILVKFDDDSEITVQNQKLMVTSHITSIARKQKAPDDAIEVKLMLGEGVKVEIVDNHTQRVLDTRNGDKDNPLHFNSYLAKPDTNLNEYINEVLRDTIFNLVNVKSQDGYVDPEWKGQEDNFIASEANNIFTAKATKQHTVTFNTDGGSDIAEKKVKNGAKLEGVNNPTKEGFVFSGWKEEGTQELFDLDKAITKDTTLVAVWEAQVQKMDGDKEVKEPFIKVIFNKGENGKLTFEDNDVQEGNLYYKVYKELTFEQAKEKGMKLPNIVANDGFKVSGRNGGWDKPLELNKTNIVFTAKYFDAQRGEVESNPSVRVVEYLSSDENKGMVDVKREILRSVLDAFKGATAKAKEGYVFVNWTNEKGEEVSKNEKFVPETKVYAKYFANFKKQTDKAEEQKPNPTPQHPEQQKPKKPEGQKQPEKSGNKEEKTKEMQNQKNVSPNKKEKNKAEKGRISSGIVKGKENNKKSSKNKIAKTSDVFSVGILKGLMATSVAGLAIVKKKRK